MPEKGGYLLICETSNATAYAGYVKYLFRIRCSEVNELMYIGCYGFDAALHSGYGVALPLQPCTLTIDGAKLYCCYPGCAACMNSGKVWIYMNFIMLANCTK